MKEDTDSFRENGDEELRVYRTIFNCAPVLMHSSDMDGNLVTVNEYWLRTLGYTAEEVTGTRFMSYLTGESREIAEGLLPELLSTGMITNIEARAVTKSGEIIDTLVGSKVVYDSDGTPARMVTTLLDITGRKRAEEALRLRESYLTAIIENQPGLVWLKDARSRFLAANRAFARSCNKGDPEDIIGKTDFDVWPADLAEKYRLDDAAVMKTGTPVRVEELIFDKGERRWFETFKTPVWNTRGEIIGTTGYAHDITARKLEEEALRNVQKLESLGILAGGIAHDFNNLLSGIFGCIDIAVGSTSEKEVADILTKALGAIDRARGLTRQLLTFAKGGSPVKKVESLEPFIRETAKFALSGSPVSCNFRIPSNLWLCEFDKNQIGQVIDNIVINGQQAMPDGGTIDIDAENVVITDTSVCITLKAGHYVKVSVTDHGIGMPQEIIPRIFDPFFSTKAKGHGLGLATCYSIVNKHGGCIDVESEPGKGSTFHLYLPATPDARYEQTDTVTLPRRGNGTVIIMDDEHIVRYSVGKMLESIGYSVMTTKDGKEAISALRSEMNAGRKVEAMVLDLTIPGGMGGQEAIAGIRAVDAHVPVYVASGYADSPIMAAPKTYGFTGSICKPFTVTELAGLLQGDR